MTITGIVSQQGNSGNWATVGRRRRRRGGRRLQRQQGKEKCSNSEQHGVFIDFSRRVCGAVPLPPECPAARGGLRRRGCRGFAIGDGHHGGWLLRVPRLVLPETQRTVLIRHAGRPVVRKCRFSPPEIPETPLQLVALSCTCGGYKTLDPVVEGEGGSIRLDSTLLNSTRGSEVQTREVPTPNRRERVCS
ncbi:hypothetical protein C0J45_15789 [Silurus meridionalis]|nr:hypothetical protein C0J45_15789 [Silurus meridionalis]